MSMFDFESWSIDIRDNLPVEYTHTHAFSQGKTLYKLMNVNS